MVGSVSSCFLLFVQNVAAVILSVGHYETDCTMWERRDREKLGKGCFSSTLYPQL